MYSKVANRISTMHGSIVGKITSREKWKIETDVIYISGYKCDVQMYHKVAIFFSSIFKCEEKLIPFFACIIKYEKMN